jgi:hypothetical protein
MGFPPFDPPMKTPDTRDVQEYSRFSFDDIQLYGMDVPGLPVPWRDLNWQCSPPSVECQPASFWAYHRQTWMC